MKQQSETVEKMSEILLWLCNRAVNQIQERHLDAGDPERFTSCEPLLLLSPADRRCRTDFGVSLKYIGSNGQPAELIAKISEDEYREVRIAQPLEDRLLRRGSEDLPAARKWARHPRRIWRLARLREDISEAAAETLDILERDACMPKLWLVVDADLTSTLLSFGVNIASGCQSVEQLRMMVAVGGCCCAK